MSGDESFALRPAGRADAAALAAIYGHHVATGSATFELARPTVEEMARRHAEITEAGYPFFVVSERRAGSGRIRVRERLSRPSGLPLHGRGLGLSVSRGGRTQGSEDDSSPR